VVSGTFKKGDVGAVVHCYKNGKAFEVEFVTSGGETIALLTLTQKDIRPINCREILYVREPASSLMLYIQGQ
jgi:hypothetical protein